MKINWGTSIVIAFVAFISFILFFVVRMTMDNSANHDLVTEEYYKEELGYQREINAENNAKEDGVSLIVKKTNEGVEVVFPSDLNPNKIKGKVSLYRPSDKTLDFDFDVHVKNSKFTIPDKNLVQGRWNIKVDWQYNNEDYLHKEQITY